MRDMNAIVGAASFVFITLDTLRYDVARDAADAGDLGTMARHLGPGGWECRHSPASFTYAAHHAFFAGFLPTPTTPGPHPRLFAAEFEGSLTTTSNTWTYPEATLPEGLRAAGYHTICIGGTGFFNRRSALGEQLPSLFDEAHWDPTLGVADAASEKNQVALAVERIAAAPKPLVFLFINIAAIHQPNRHYLDGAADDSIESHRAALIAVDRALPPLFEALEQRGPTFCILCSDHGTAYGESGYAGHRVAHEVVWQVPYAEFML